MAEFDELLVTTGVDALVRLVKDKSKIELTDAAQLLNIPENTIEEWAGILEQEGILRIEYRLTKIFIVWITPTEEELDEEKEEFYQKKRALDQEIKELKSKVTPEIESVSEFSRSFNELYSKISPKLSDLEKKLEAVAKTKSGGSQNIDVYLQKIDAASERLSEINQAVSGALGDLDEVSGKVENGPGAAALAKLETLATTLGNMKNDLVLLKQKAGKKPGVGKGEMPSIDEMKVKLNETVKEFKDMKERSAKLRQDLIELQEGKDVLKVIGDSMRDYEKRIAAMKNDIAALSTQANEIKETSAKIAAKIDKDKETLERFSDSIDVARGILSRFPSQKNITDELEKIEKSERLIDERTKALKKLLDVAGGAGAIAVDFEELSAKIDEKTDQLTSGMEEIATSLEDQKSTFMTFQEIKEKIAPSLSKYKKELSELSVELKGIRKDVEVQTKTLEAEAARIQENMGKGDLKEIMAVADEIESRKSLLENIKDSIDSLSNTSENLGKRLAILSRQAGMLEIRGGGEGTQLSAQQKSDISSQISLTRQEEEDFKKKREELRTLIKKLWEDEKK